MTNTSNLFSCNVAANSIAKLSDVLASIGLDAGQIAIVVNFCRRGAEVDASYRQANGGGRVIIGPSTYSRRGKTHTEKRGVDYHAFNIRKAVWNACKNNPDKFGVVFTLDHEGALYAEIEGAVWRYERNYDFSFSAVESEVVEPENTDCRLLVSAAGVHCYKY